MKHSQLILRRRACRLCDGVTKLAQYVSGDLDQSPMRQPLGVEGVPDGTCGVGLYGVALVGDDLDDSVPDGFGNVVARPAVLAALDEGEHDVDIPAARDHGRELRREDETPRAGGLRVRDGGGGVG